MNSYSLVWVQNGRVRSQGLGVIELLKNANAKGLEPEDYDGSRWQGRLRKLGQSPSEQDLISFRHRAYGLRDALHPRSPRWPREPQGIQVSARCGGLQLPLAEFVQTHVLNASDPVAEIQKTEPPFLGYKKLLALLPVYEGYAKQDDGQKLPTITKTVRPGQPYADLARLD
jgi:hypothetical protein